MDSDIKQKEIPDRLTPEKIKFYKYLLEKATPYTEEEVEEIGVDSTDYDIDRMLAYNAKWLLTQYGLL